jgi:hypothetical protein
MGLTLNVPTFAEAEGNMVVTWSTVATDPKFSLLLNNANGETFDAAQGIAPSPVTNDTVALGQVPPGTYTLTAVQADDIEKVLSTTGSFTVSPAGTPPPPAAAAAPPPAGNNAATGGAATGAGGAVAACPPVAAAAPPPAAAAPPPATAKAAPPKGGAKAGKAAPKPPAKAAPKKAPAKAPAKKPAHGRGRSVSSVKFGRRELYRD